MNLMEFKLAIIGDTRYGDLEDEGKFFQDERLKELVY